MESTTCAAPETNTISESILTKRSRVEISSSPEHHLLSYRNLQVKTVVIAIRNVHPVGN